MARTCTVPRCERKPAAKGYCRLHYDRWRDKGYTDSEDERMRKPLKSDNLRLPDLTPSQEANLCALVRNLR